MGQPLAWFEVISDDAERAQRFYAELFDWTVSTDPSMGTYGIVDTGNGEDAVAGGIGAPSGRHDLPPHRPPHRETGVKIYLRVDDLEAYLAKAEKLGGKRLVEPMALPGDFGTIAILADPDGNPVGLWA
jgi:predicted enzyme related to lactoylglutathione lyase